MKITVETTVAAPVEEVWRAWTTPEDIKRWNAASDDWHTTAATVDLRVGGQFSSRMEAKDGSMGFDFAGTYTKIVPHELIECTFGDRTLSVQFIRSGDRVTVRETFDAEETHTAEQQRAGWQAILDRFARHVKGPAKSSFSRRRIAPNFKEGEQMEQTSIPRWQTVTGWVFSGILAFVFLPSAFFKIAQPAGFLDEWSKTYPASSALPLGVIEAALFVLYLVPKMRYLGGLLMLAYLGGAVATHLHAGDGMFFVPVLVGVVGWLGLYLRDRKLRALVPTVDE